MAGKIIRDHISREELGEIAKNQFGNLVKAVVDTENRIMAVGGEMHADLETLLMDQGSSREHTWGINLMLEVPSSDWVEFNSMINIKPSFGNRSRNVENPDVRKTILEIVKKLTS